ncbi:MAG: hypothetical protein UY41_C0029G0003 [Candidatus Moranbacteria bacterium GW2011_GWE1_49_15]|nr:MAG: hypothetical protein UX75_C0033G0002 [Candidatus Moranbacteria bacterium GW2011_GWE2_47_10]KKW06328.1 MAG: hypothetical protein UY41_C0029G0003 [Candidatus Moranbacteria bacterium GW2011_GWE1_49_15]
MGLTHLLLFERASMRISANTHSHDDQMHKPQGILKQS